MFLDVIMPGRTNITTGYIYRQHHDVYISLYININIYIYIYIYIYIFGITLSCDQKWNENQKA